MNLHMQHTQRNDAATWTSRYTLFGIGLFKLLLSNRNKCIEIVLRPNWNDNVNKPSTFNGRLSQFQRQHVARRWWGHGVPAVEMSQPLISRRHTSVCGMKIDGWIERAQLQAVANRRTDTYMITGALLHHGALRHLSRLFDDKFAGKYFREIHSFKTWVRNTKF